MRRILVAYATRNGSTREVAEAVAGALGAAGAEADLRPASGLRGPLAEWDTVVIGAPIYSGRWHRDAQRFIKRHRSDLGRVPVAIFGMGPRSDTEEAWQHSRQQLDRALARRDWLSPVMVTVFGGVDPPKRGVRQGRDLRDWDAIRAWAEQVLRVTTARA